MYMYGINYMEHHQTTGYIVLIYIYIYISFSDTFIYIVLYHHINDTLKADAVKRAKSR